MKKGFTLIELLAVIIILAVIALIATPVVLNVVNDAKVEANRNSTYGVLDAAKYYYAESLLDSSITGMDGKTNLIDKIVVSGKQPESGTLYIKSSGEVAVAAVYENKCYSKEFNESEVTVTDDASNCSVQAATESGSNTGTGSDSNNSGSESGSNPGTDTGSGTTPTEDTTAPTVTVNSTSSTGSSISINVTCSDPSGIMGNVGYTVYNGNDAQEGYGTAANGETYTMSGLSPNVTYSVIVQCCDNSNRINCVSDNVDDIFGENYSVAITTKSN